LRKIAADSISIYESSQYAEKQLVSDEIVRLVHKQGGLFLKPEKAWWVEVDKEAAREKVSKYHSSWVTDDIVGLYRI